MASPSVHNITRRILRQFHSLVKPAIVPNPVAKNLSQYLLAFFTILTTHMTQEFEVRIRDGSVTEEGRHSLRKLASEFAQFQYKERIPELLTPWVDILSGQANV